MSTTFMPRRGITAYASATPTIATAPVTTVPAQVAGAGTSWLRTDIRPGSAANATAASSFARSAVSATKAATVVNAAKAASAATAGKHGAPPRGNPN